MAAVESVNKQTTSDVLAAGNVAVSRMVEFIVDFDNDEATLASGDHLNLMTFPKGTIVLMAGAEQLVADTTGTTSTLTVRAGSVEFSGTLTGNDAVGTFTAAAAVDTDILTADTDLNILAGTDDRAEGKVRVFALVVESYVPQVATTVDRDVLA